MAQYITVLVPGSKKIKKHVMSSSQSTNQKCRPLFFKNGPTPASFSFIFGLFTQTSLQFLQQINVKNVTSIQYTAPGFELTMNRLP